MRKYINIIKENQADDVKKLGAMVDDMDETPDAEEVQADEDAPERESIDDKAERIERKK